MLFPLSVPTPAYRMFPLSALKNVCGDRPENVTGHSQRVANRLACMWLWNERIKAK